MQTTNIVVTVILGATCGLVVMAMTLCLLCWIRHARKKRLKSSQYQKLLPGCTGHVDPNQYKAQVLPAIRSLKTVPFEVPGPVVARGWGSVQSSLSSEDYTDSLDLTAPSPLLMERERAYSLGSLDPSLYKMVDTDDDYDIPDNHIGRVWFAVEYERESEKLLVTLIKAKNLVRWGMSAQERDTYVRLYLLPDERRYLQSKCKKKSNNPKYEESFVFQVPLRIFQERVLKLSVFVIDRHKRHRVLGYATLPLRGLDVNTVEKIVIWRDLERELPQTTLDRGELMISLCYNHNHERLTVGVYEGRSFKPADDKCPPDFYLKVCQLHQSRIAKSKKTDIVRNSEHPVFNESFTFRLPQNMVDSTSVSVTAMQALSGTKDRVVGRVILGSFMFARGKELEHWNEMIGNQKQQIMQWHVIS